MAILASLLVLMAAVNYTGSFREGDWVNFEDFRFITSAAEDQTTIYFGTTSGVIRYDRFANQWLDPMTASDGIPDDRIDNIAYDPSNDQLWVATPLGNAYYQPTFQQWYPGSDFPINLTRNDYRVSSFGVLTAPFGYIYQNGRLSDMNFNSYQLTRGVDDGFNHLYTGTWGYGAVVINTRYGRLDLLPFGPYSDDVTALVKVDGEFWMGGGSGEGIEPGLSWCDTSMQNWRWYVPRFTDGLASARLTCALGDKKSVWLGTDYGVVRYDKQDDYFTTFADFAPLPSTYVTALAADSAWIYVGTDNGLGFVSRAVEAGHVKRKKPSSEGDTVQAESSNVVVPLTSKNRMRGFRINNLEVIHGYLYVATDRGALRRPLGSYQDFEYVNTPDKMLSTEILDIAALGDSLLFGTRDDIVVIDSATGAVSSITDQAYFGQWHIRKIIVDNGNIWGATDLGLWKYRLSDGYSRLFTVTDGMLSSDIRTIEIVGDYIWMATPRGVIRFYWNNPQRID